MLATRRPAGTLALARNALEQTQRHNSADPFSKGEAHGKGGNKIVITMLSIISFFHCSRDEQARCKRCVDMIIMMTAGDAEDVS